MGNTVGSKNFFISAEDFYILGLWLADGYWRSSSVGLTSVNPLLINKFKRFFENKFPEKSIKERIYEVDGISKRKQKAVQVYINSRPITRLFMSYKSENLSIPPRFLLAYLAGRIDGDGHVDAKHRSGIRIAYGTQFDAKRDQLLFGTNNVSLYEYKAAKTYVLYLKKAFRESIGATLQLYSLKLAP